MSKLMYKPVSVAVSVLGGIAAGAIFKQVWRLAAHEEEAPSATDPRRGWPEILIAAALEGAVFSVVRAALERGTATAAREFTGGWPGEEGGAKEREETK
jgi:hypothetical protein